MPRAGVYRWVIVGLLATLYMINFMDKAVIGLSAQKIMGDLHITPTQFGGIGSSFFILFIVTSLFGGVLADRFAARNVLSIMALIWSLAMVPVLGVTSLTGLVVSRMVLGAGEGPTAPVGTHAIFKWFDSQSRVVPQAVYAAGPPVAIIFGAPFLTWVIQDYGWRDAFAMLGGFSLIWLIVWLTFGREGPEVIVKGDVLPAAGALGAGVYMRTILSRTYLACVCFGFPAYLILSVMLAWLPSFLTKGLGFTPRQTGLLVSLDWVILGVFPIVTGIISQGLMRRGYGARYSLGYVAGFSVVIAAIALFAVPKLDHGPLQLALLLIGFAFPAMITPVLFTILANIVPSPWRGGVLGSFSALIVSAGLLGPIAIGYAIQHSAGQNYFSGFVFLAFVLLVGGIVGLVLIDPDHDRERLQNTIKTKEVPGDEVIPVGKAAPRSGRT